MAALNNDSSGWDFPSAAQSAPDNNNEKKDDQAQSFDDFFAAGPDLSSAKPSDLNADGLQKYVGFDTNSSLIQNPNPNPNNNNNQAPAAAPSDQNDLAQFFD